ncbi:hypothetical protein LXA43DRAFT_1066194 [Ganoderma leucocontextum]|nr:hypothetical protein LXA43DRAFT_1066194 [Ganoderma leucocontextum]
MGGFGRTALDEEHRSAGELYGKASRVIELGDLDWWVILVNIGTPAFRRRVVELIPLEDVQRMRDISDVLYERSLRIFPEKKAAQVAKGDEAMKHEIGEGRDIMSLSIHFKPGISHVRPRKQA